MQRQISEEDWKLLRRLKPIALDRYCSAVLSEVARVVSDARNDSHAKYLELYKLIEDRDEQLADAFNELKRSSALMKLVHMRGLGLLTDKEFAGFSPETRSVVTVLIEGEDAEQRT